MNKKAKKIIETIIETGAVVYTSMVLFYIGVLDIAFTYGVTYRGYVEIIVMIVLIQMLIRNKVKEWRAMVSKV